MDGTDDIKKTETQDPLSPYMGTIYDCVILDASNIITTGNGPSRRYVISRLPIVIQAIQKLGWPTLVGIKKKTFNHFLYHSEASDKEKKMMQKIVNSLSVSLIDSEEDDLWLIQTAIKENGWILSEDRFRNEIEKYSLTNPPIANEIKKRRCFLQFVGEKPQFKIPKRDTSTIINTRMKQSHKKISNIIKNLTTIDCQLKAANKQVPISIKFGIPIGRRHFTKVLDIPVMGTVSSGHFRIDKNGSILTITDIGSTNGTKLNGLLIAPHEPFILEKDTKYSLEIGSKEISLTLEW